MKLLCPYNINEGFSRNYFLTTSALGYFTWYRNFAHQLVLVIIKDDWYRKSIKFYDRSFRFSVVGIFKISIPVFNKIGDIVSNLMFFIS